MQGRNLPDNWGYLTPPSYRFTGSSIRSIAADFFAKAIGRYVDANLEYRKTIGANDFPFYSGEFQNQAILYKSMSDVRKPDCLAFPEHHYQYRHRKAKAENRRLDYWVLLRRNSQQDIVLLAEYKHLSVSLRQKGIYDKSGCLRGHFANTSALRDGWWNNGQTLKRLGKNLKRNNVFMADMSSWDGCNRDIVLVNMVTVPIELTSTIKEKVSEAAISKDEMDDWSNELTKMLQPIPNWRRHWWLGAGPGRESQEVDHWKERRRTYYSKYFGVFFFVRLDVL